MQFQRVLSVPALIVKGTSQYMGFHLLVKCLTILQTLWEYLIHYHIREALYLVHQLHYMIFLSLISHELKAESLISLCCVLMISVYLFSALCYTTRSLGVENMTFHICIYSLCCLKQHSLSEKKFNRIFQERCHLGSEVSNQSCIKYLMLDLHEIPYFILYTLYFGFTDNYKIYLFIYASNFPFYFLVLLFPVKS